MSISAASWRRPASKAGRTSAGISLPRGAMAQLRNVQGSVHLLLLSWVREQVRLTLGQDQVMAQRGTQSNETDRAQKWGSGL